MGWFITYKDAARPVLNVLFSNKGRCGGDAGDFFSQNFCRNDIIVHEMRFRLRVESVDAATAAAGGGRKQLKDSPHPTYMQREVRVSPAHQPRPPSLAQRAAPAPKGEKLR